MPVMRVKQIKKLSRTRPVGRKARTTAKKGGKAKARPLRRRVNTLPMGR